MNGLFIVNQEIGHNAHKVARLSEEFKKASVDIEVFVNNGTLHSCQKLGGTALPLKKSRDKTAPRWHGDF